MDFDEARSFVCRIIGLEFSERDHDLRSSISELKQQMSSRGVLNSTMALSQLADFVVAELQARTDLIAHRALDAIKSTGLACTAETAAEGINLYSMLALRQVTHLQALYDEAALAVDTGLRSGMPREIRQQLRERMESCLERTQLTLEFESKILVAGPKEVLALRPTFYGVGIDLKELWRRFFPRP